MKFVFRKLLFDKQILKTLKVLSHSNATNAPKIVKLKPERFNSILNEDLKLLRDVFLRNKFELRIAGGAVRDLLMDIVPHDIDLATNALPDEMLDIFKREKIRILNFKGLKHGTVPIRINDRVKFNLRSVFTFLFLFQIIQNFI